jgi:hypothetical protein
MPPPNTSTTQIQIDNLADRMDAGFMEIKEMLRSYEERTRSLETKEAGCQPVIHARLDAHQQAIADHTTKLATKSVQVNTLEKSILTLGENINNRLAKLAVMYNILGAIGIVLLASIIGLIWSLITGQATLVFK